MQLVYAGPATEIANQPLVTLTPIVTEQPRGTALQYAIQQKKRVSGSGTLNTTIANGVVKYGAADECIYELLIECKAVDRAGVVLDTATSKLIIEILPDTYINYEPLDIQVGDYGVIHPGVTSVMSTGFEHEFQKKDIN